MKDIDYLILSPYHILGIISVIIRAKHKVFNKMVEVLQIGKEE
jgi:hypothetical protein